MRSARFSKLAIYVNNVEPLLQEIYFLHQGSGAVISIKSRGNRMIAMLGSVVVIGNVSHDCNNRQQNISPLGDQCSVPYHPLHSVGGIAI